VAGTRSWASTTMRPSLRRTATTISASTPCLSRSPPLGLVRARTCTHTLFNCGVIPLGSGALGGPVPACLFPHSCGPAAAARGSLAAVLLRPTRVHSARTTQRTHARYTHARLCGTRRRHSQMENTLGCSVRSTACAGCMLHRVRRMLYRCCHARAACRDGCHGVRSRIAALHAPLHAVWSATVAHCRLLLVDAVSAW
jgi:hypothetical protein